MTQPDPEPVPGLHHVTAVAGDPDANLRFFREALGLRLVKRTVNFDDVSTYHLYYADGTGSPGTAYTVFPVGDGRRGRNGAGEVSAAAFAVPEGSLDYWRDRLEGRGAEVRRAERRFGDEVLPFTDPDGQELELVEAGADGVGGVEPWDGSPVPADHQIRGLYGVTLRVADVGPTAGLLDAMGYERVDAAGDRTRFRAAGDRAAVVDLVERPDAARAGGGVGSVHHVAFRVSDGEAQAALRERGLHATPVKDRRYFRSVYVREPGGVLFEFATDGPGFGVDESVGELGSTLRLPTWLEDDRDRIEAGLPDLSADAAERGTAGTDADADAEAVSR